MIVATILGHLSDISMLLAGGLALCAALMLLPAITSRQRLVVAAIGGVGLAETVSGR